MEDLTHGSLFSGIGGFDLAFGRAGFRPLWQVEIDPYATAVLAKQFPEAKRHSDIRSVHGVLAHAKSGVSGEQAEPERGKGVGGGSQEVPCVDCLKTPTILTGGFPCQPFSVAGKRRGAADDRFLWPEMLRVIAEVRPRWVVAENVPGIIKMALDQVLSDLEAIGYTTGAVTVPACAVDAPHRRERLWIVGHSRLLGQAKHEVEATGIEQPGQDVADTERMRCRGGSDTSKERREGLVSREQERCQVGSQTERRRGNVNGRWLPEPNVGLLADELPAGLVRWSPEPEGVPRVETGVKDRVQKLKALGNAIVPQVAEEIAWHIRTLEESLV